MQNRDLILKALLVGALVAIAGTALVIGIQCLLFADAPQVWDCLILDPQAQVYDGDTIKDVRVKIHDHAFDKSETGFKWPGVFISEDGVFIVTDIRIAGIDTPEKRVSTKNPDGTKRSEASRERERAAAKAAQQALIDIITNNGGNISITEPKHGKYAGRTVADVAVDERDIASLLIEYGHAKAYDGGTKPDWGWGK